MEYKRGRYSWLLRPFLIVFDLSVINILALQFFNFNSENLYFFSSQTLNNKHLLYIFYSIVFWLLTAFFLKFYKVYRYSTLLNIFSLLVKQFCFYTIIFFAFIGIFRSINIQAFETFSYLISCFVLIGFFKIASFYALKKYRTYFNGNIRKVIIIGNNANAIELKTLFESNKELGYNLLGVFSDNNSSSLSGKLMDSFNLLKKNKNIDEIFCSIDELTENQVNKYVKYANLNHSNIKFISNVKNIYSKRLKTDFYNYLPVFSIQDVALNNDVNKVIKRAFDILFSLFIIVFILSWVTIILFILIKLESKGPLFYKHKRNGINYKEFNCYKFRSLKTTKSVKGTYVKQDDERMTKTGKFLRKTSLDELPQFFNVLKGDMSVVGPRPHMLSYTEDYSKKIDKYNFIFRHNVKPGVTGLAQIKGYRGEIKSDEDIINRIKFDIFYIENWSLLLDIKIILQTIRIAIKGDEKAY